MPISVDPNRIMEMKKLWTDKLVRIKAEIQEYKRFEGRVGRVVTINWSGKAIVDFADGAWYDIDNPDVNLHQLSGEDPDRSKYDPKANSAQVRPDRQG